MTLGYLDLDAETYVRGFAGALHETLGERLVGVYLHGSGALGGFSPAGCSDIDLLGVVAATIDELTRRRLSGVLVSASEGCPAAGGLECSIVTAQAAAEPSPAPPYELYLDTLSGEVGRDERIDPDLPSIFAVCREAGIAVVGPDPGEVFGEVDMNWVVQSWLADLRAAEREAPQAYRVLNVCRIWRSLEEGGFWSKLEAGAWARDRAEDPSLIDAAVAFQRGVPGPPVDRLATSAFVDGVLKRLHFPA